LTSQLPELAESSVASRGARIVLPGQSPDGAYILSVLVKRTFDIVPNGECTLAAEDRPLLPGDVFWDDPMNSSPRYESDFVPFKPATDVVLNGVAYAPGGAPTRACTVTLRVGDRIRSIGVIGDRVAHYVEGGTPSFTDPAPFTTMELRYERAYGGTDVYSDLKVPYPYPRNPLGRGFVVRNTPRSVDNLPLPNLEDPAAPLTPSGLCLEDYAAWQTRPVPAGFGWFPKTSVPRAFLAGIMPADRAVEKELRQAYAQLVPVGQREAYLKNGIRDMDFRFFNGASEGLAMPYLRGGEWVVTENLTPLGRLYFQLPPAAPRIGLDIGEGVQEPEVVLQTVMIRMEDGQLDMVWRGALPYRGPAWLPEMRKMEVHVA
jgi:hypothetical protein